jgi:hypothetical protein
MQIKKNNQPDALTYRLAARLERRADDRRFGRLPDILSFAFIVTAAFMINALPATGATTFAEKNSQPTIFNQAYNALVGFWGLNESPAVESAALTSTVQFTSTTFTAAEGTTAIVTVSRTGDTSESASVTFSTANGTAVGGEFLCGPGVDYISNTITFTFAPGDSSATAIFQICADNVPEGDETVNLILSNPVGTSLGAPSTATLVITGDSPPAVIALSSATYAVNEGSGTVTVTVTRAGENLGAATVNYNLTNGSATGGASCGASGADFVNTGGAVAFAAGETSQTFTIQICDDAALEPNETFTVTLSNPTGNSTLGSPVSATVTINDNDAPPPSVSISDFSAQEGNAGTTAFTFNVFLSNPTGQTVTVNYRTVDGTATAGSDYTAVANGVLTFNPGETSKQIVINVIGDTAFEANETFFVNLTGATNATISDGVAIGIILNDDQSTGTIAISDARVTEGNSGTVTATFTVTVTGGVAASVNYVTVGGTATAGTDYNSAAGTLVFAAGETTKTIQVTVNGDTLKEANETFFVILTDSGGAPIVDQLGAGIIVDDDRAYVADFDGDRRADFSVFRPGDNNWYIYRSGSQTPFGSNFGEAGDIPVPGDYDGDGRADLAVFRPSIGFWIIRRSSDSVLVARQWGLATDKLVQGDYDGDGRTDIAVFRNGVWFIVQSSNNQEVTAFFGTAGDIPVQGDYDGDAKTDFAVYRQGDWYINRSSDGQLVVRNWGLPTDIPLVGDFDGDGRADLTVYRQGEWFILSSLTNNFGSVPFGLPTDIPVVADYDGDGSSDVAVFRPSTGNWFVLQSSNGAVISAQWGQNGDIPIPAAYQSR